MSKKRLRRSSRRTLATKFFGGLVDDDVEEDGCPRSHSSSSSAAGLFESSLGVIGEDSLYKKDSGVAKVLAAFWTCILIPVAAASVRPAER
jgi:hypothetical protein